MNLNTCKIFQQNRYINNKTEIESSFNEENSKLSFTNSFKIPDFVINSSSCELLLAHLLALDIYQYRPDLLISESNDQTPTVVYVGNLNVYLHHGIETWITYTVEFGSKNKLPSFVYSSRV